MHRLAGLLAQPLAAPSEPGVREAGMALCGGLQRPRLRRVSQTGPVPGCACYPPMVRIGSVPVAVAPTEPGVRAMMCPALSMLSTWVILGSPRAETRKVP